MEDGTKIRVRWFMAWNGEMEVHGEMRVEDGVMKIGVIGRLSKRGPKLVSLYIHSVGSKKKEVWPVRGLEDKIQK